MGWPIVKLHDVARQVQRPETPQPGTSYRQIGVRLWGQDAYQRVNIEGSNTKYSTLFLVREGDIVVNKIWARNGSMSVITQELDGSFGSSEFPTYEVDKSALLPEWFAWFSKTRPLWIQCENLSRGTSGQNRLRPIQFLQVQIPLPPLDEQRRIVARLDRVAVMVGRARRLLERLDREAVLLTQSLHVHLSSERRRPFGEFIELWEDREPVEAETRYPQPELRVLRAGCLPKHPSRDQRLRIGPSTAYTRVCSWSVNPRDGKELWQYATRPWLAGLSHLNTARSDAERVSYYLTTWIC